MAAPDNERRVPGWAEGSSLADQSWASTTNLSLMGALVAVDGGFFGILKLQRSGIAGK